LFILAGSAIFGLYEKVEKIDHLLIPGHLKVGVCSEASLEGKLGGDDEDYLLSTC
jgi:hypothetical protein